MFLGFLFLEATAHQEKEAQEHNATIDAVILPLKKQQDEFQKEFAAKVLEQGLAKLPAVIRDDVRLALTAPPSERTAVQKYLGDKFQTELKPVGPLLLKKLHDDADYNPKHQQLVQAIAQQESRKRTFPEIRAFY